jgi:hypothetical protein
MLNRIGDIGLMFAMIIAMSIYSDIRLSIFKHIECSDSYLFIG